MLHQLKNGQFQLKPSEVKRIINAADNPRDRIIIELLYYCGLRRQEVVKIQPGDIDHDRALLQVRGKGNKIRLVPVPGDVLADIRFFLGRTERPYLFPARKKSRAPLNALMVNHALKRAGEAARVVNPNPRMKNINPHLLRHSAARRLKDSKVPMEAIAAFLGHDNIDFTARTYGLYGMDEICEKVAAVLC